VPSAKVGLPEVQIGIRLAPEARTFAASGRPEGGAEPITSAVARRRRQLGIVDGSSPRAAQGSRNRSRASQKRPLPRSNRDDKPPRQIRSRHVRGVPQSIARRARNQRAPYACIEAIEAAAICH
jgi:hypothetical protein